MVVDIIGSTITYWMTYVFGSPAIAGVIFMFFILLWGLRMGWSFDVFIVLFIPLIFMIAITSTDIGLTSIWGIILVASGLIIGLAFRELIKNR